MSHVVRALGATLGLAVVVSGCSSDESEPAVGGIADVAAIEQEYQDVAESNELPAGRAWPGPAFEADSYSTGYGTERAYEVWRCHWVRAATTGSEADREAAMTELSEYLDSDQFAGADAAERGIFKNVVTDAEDGSTEGLEDYLEASCDGIV